MRPPIGGANPTARSFLPGNVHVSQKDCSQRWRDCRLKVMKANMLQSRPTLTTPSAAPLPRGEREVSVRMLFGSGHGPFADDSRPTRPYAAS
jgi:hypothetical protein